MASDTGGPWAPALLDLRSLGTWARRLLITQAVIGALAVGIELQFGSGFDDEDGGSSLYLLIALLQIIIFIAGAIIFLRWTYRASANLRTLGAQGLGPSPGWAIGWYFVPIASLGMPFVAMKEIWKASIEPQDWEIVRATPMLGWWWGFWLLSNIAGISAFRIEYQDRFDGANRVAEMLTTFSDSMTIAASLLLAAIARKVTAVQGDYASTGS